MLFAESGYRDRATMTAVLDDLLEGAVELSDVAAGRREGAAASRLAERLRTGRFQISVVGEFKRGKSTLVNALVGEAAVPTGVLPLTAVATELEVGEPSATVVHVDGSVEKTSRNRLADYVAEQLNPQNVKQVARVVVRGRWPLLTGGVVLVDTPGTGSSFEHNTAAARAALLEADGAIVVLSADSPLSATELDMLDGLRERRAPTFFVLNKVDHLEEHELEQVHSFVTTALVERVGRASRVFRVDARAALAARQTGHRAAPFEFPELLAHIEQFVANDLVGALAGAARRELATICRSLLEALHLEEAALKLDADESRQLSDLFLAAAGEQYRTFEDDRTLLRRDVDRLISQIRGKLDDFARGQPPLHFSALESAAAQAGPGDLNVKLRQQVEKSVKASFDAFRADEAESTERDWQAIAEAFRHRTEERVAAIRSAAADLFTVPLNPLPIPPVASEREQFFYLFLRVGSSTDLITAAAGRLMPVRVAKPRALRRARADLAQEFAKHAGRAGSDLERRLHDAAHKLEAAMEEEMKSTAQAIHQAAARADERRRAAEAQQVILACDADAQRRLAENLITRLEDGLS